jgi:hypothetical protein
MALEVNCPNCLKSYRFAEDTAGKKFQCKACQQQFVIGNPMPANIVVPVPGPSVQVSPGSSKKGRQKRTGRAPARKFNRPGLLGIVFDFDFKFYYTAQVIRTQWLVFVLTYIASWVAVISFIWRELNPDLRAWSAGDMTFQEVYYENWRWFVLGTIIQLLGFNILLSCRVALELVVVIFNISETLEFIEEKP